MEKTPIEQLIYETEVQFYHNSSDIPAVEYQLQKYRDDLLSNKIQQREQVLKDGIANCNNKKESLNELVAMLRVKLDYLYGLRNDSKAKKSGANISK